MKFHYLLEGREMADNPSESVTIADSAAVEWVEHARFPGIFVRKLLTALDNPLANVNEVLIPPGGLIGNHGHHQQVETVYVLAGKSLLRMGDEEFSFRTGQVVAIPIGMEHTLRNVGEEDVHLLTMFTPPIS